MAGRRLGPAKAWPFLRDVALFVGGLAGVAHETLVAKSERPTLLLLFAAMMGLPAFLRADDKRDDAPAAPAAEGSAAPPAPVAPPPSQ